MADAFTTDFTRYARAIQRIEGSQYPLTMSNESLGITEDRIHNGTISGSASHYGIRAELRPNRKKGVIYQIVHTTLRMQYESGEIYEEDRKYVEAWVIYSGKPAAYDFLTDERNGELWYGEPMYNTGRRKIDLITWFVPKHNTRTLQSLGFSTDVEIANGLWGTTNLWAVTVPTDSIHRVLRFKWDYINQTEDRMYTEHYDEQLA